MVKKKQPLAAGVAAARAAAWHQNALCLRRWQRAPHMGENEEISMKNSGQAISNQRNGGSLKERNIGGGMASKPPVVAAAL